MIDPRHKYAVRLDAELERGEAGALERYQRAAELALREPEEWEFERSASLGVRPGWARISFDEMSKFSPGDWVAIDGQRINGEALRRLIPHWPSMVQFFESMGFEVAQVPTAFAIDIRRSRPRPQLQNFVDGVLDDNQEAAMIAAAHGVLDEPVSRRSWRVCSNAYQDPARRTSTQLVSVLADWMQHPGANRFRAAAMRERADQNERQLGLSRENGFSFARRR